MKYDKHIKILTALVNGTAHEHSAADERAAFTDAIAIMRAVQAKDEPAELAEVRKEAEALDAWIHACAEDAYYARGDYQTPRAVRLRSEVARLRDLARAESAAELAAVKGQVERLREAMEDAAESTYDPAVATYLRTALEVTK